MTYYQAWRAASGMLQHGCEHFQLLQGRERQAYTYSLKRFFSIAV